MPPIDPSTLPSARSGRSFAGTLLVLVLIAGPVAGLGVGAWAFLRARDDANTADRILDDPLVRDFCNTAMTEAAAIGAAIGCGIDQAPEDRNAVTRKLGAFKTSMLQDAEAKRAIELDAIVGAVAEIGRRVGVATPSIDALLGLTRLFARVHGLYPEAD